jgi:hypothetical protein
MTHDQRIEKLTKYTPDTNNHASHHECTLGLNTGERREAAFQSRIFFLLIFFFSFIVGIASTTQLIIPLLRLHYDKITELQVSI